MATRHRHLGIVPLGARPGAPGGHGWHDERRPALAFDHGAIVLAGRERLRVKLSDTNIGFALAPETFSISELRARLRRARLPGARDHPRRVLERRGLLEATASAAPRAARSAARRPSPLRSRDMAVTDPFAVLRPPGSQRGP